MKILYFHQHFSTRQGATGTRSYEFARRMVSRGHEVTVVCGSYGVGHTGLGGEFAAGVRRGIVDGIDVVELHLPYSNADSFLRRAWTFLRFVKSSLRFALAPGYDLLFATSTPLTAAIPGIIFRAVRRRPFVFEVRDLWPELPRAMGAIRNPIILWSMDVLETAAYRSADACIGLAPGIVAGILRKAPDKRVAMIPNGSDLGLEEASSEVPQELGRLLESLDGKLKCIFAGAHGMANGLEAVLDAAAELKKRGNDDVVFLFIGEGMMKPGLQERATRERLDNCVFLDPVPKQILTTLQSRMDVGLMVLKNVPAFYDGTSPNKFFDYLSSGLAVLINYPGWLASLVSSKKCGIAVPPDDPRAFADAIQRLQTASGMRREMGANARALAVQEFDRERLAGQFIQFVETVGGV